MYNENVVVKQPRCSSSTFVCCVSVVCVWELGVCAGFRKSRGFAPDARSEGERGEDRACGDWSYTIYFTSAGRLFTDETRLFTGAPQRAAAAFSDFASFDRRKMHERVIDVGTCKRRAALFSCRHAALKLGLRA